MKLSSKMVLQISIGIMCFTFFLLFFLEPFGDLDHNYSSIGAVRIFTYAFTAGFLFYISESFLKKMISRFNSGRLFDKILWYFIEFIIISIGIFFCRYFWVGGDNVNVYDITNVLYKVFVLTLIPIIVIVLYSTILNTKEKAADNLKIVSTDKNPEHFVLKQHDLYMLKSAENYVEFTFSENGEIMKKLLRGSLSHFNTMLSQPFIRIHRSYIVNSLYVKKYKFNSRGGSVEIQKLDGSFPIGKVYAKKVRQKFELDFKIAKNQQHEII